LSARDALDHDHLNSGASEKTEVNGFKPEAKTNGFLIGCSFVRCPTRVCVVIVMFVRMMLGIGLSQRSVWEFRPVSHGCEQIFHRRMAQTSPRAAFWRFETASDSYRQEK
jgi:hypothetical protein